MPRFTIKDLMLGLTLVAVGLAIEVMIFKGSRDYWGTPPFSVGMIIFFSGFGMIGAGFLAPFHKKVVGGLLGVMLAVALLVLLFLTSHVD